MRQSIYLFLCLAKVIVVDSSGGGNFPLTQDKVDSSASEEFEKYYNEEERDEHIIRHAVKRLLFRPESDKYPYVIKQNVEGVDDEKEKENGQILLKYYTPKTDENEENKEKQEYGVGGVVKGELEFKTEYLNMSEEVIVVGMGDKGIGYSSRGSYIVFRKSKDVSVNNETRHYLNLAYIRRQLKRYYVEWSILDSSIIGKNRLELDFCREVPCDISDYLFGICELASHCAQPLEGPPEVIGKSMWKSSEPEIQSQKSPHPPGAGKKYPHGDGHPPQTSNPKGTRGKFSKVTERRKRRKVEETGDDKKPESATNSLSLLGAEKAEGEISTRAIKDSMPDCIECESFEQFFTDFEEDPEYAKLAKATLLKMKNDVQSDILIIQENQKTLSEHPEVPYIGNGKCNLTKLSGHNFNKTKEIEDLIKFFLNSLRLNCDPISENRVRTMFTSRLKLLEIQNDYSVGLAHSSEILKHKILTTDEFRTVMLSVFIENYIKVHRAESAKFATNPQGIQEDENNSKDVRFLTKLILETMQSFSKVFFQHFIRGHRSILRVIQNTFYMKLVSLVGVGDENEKQVGLQDLRRLMALKEFVLYGMGPTRKSGTQIEALFRSFETNNLKGIKTLVDAYEI